MKKSILVFVTVVLCAVMTGNLFAADKVAEQMKKITQAEKEKTIKIVEKTKNAVIAVELLWKIKAGNKPEQDAKQKIDGTVISEDGTIIIANSLANPASSIPAQYRAQISVKLQGVKIILDDGTEIKAKILQQDEELDTMIVKPVEGNRKFAFLKLSTEQKPAVLDTVITFTKMSAKDNRIALINMSRISGIVTKPRKYYIAGPSLVGLPALDKDGNCFGIYLQRSSGGRGAGSRFVLPSADVLDAVKRAEEDDEE